MKDPVAVQVAVHEAASAESVGEILRAFFASLTEDERQVMGSNFSTIETLTNSVVGQHALMAARQEMMVSPGDDRMPVIARVSKVLSSAALRLSVLELEERAG